MAKTDDIRLTAKQIHTLKLLYKFRFLTAPLLRDYRKQLSDEHVTRSLKLLMSKGLVIRRYKKSYRLAGKAASYTLAPKALIYLRDTFGFDPEVLHSYYKNKLVSDEYINHHLLATKIYLNLRNEQPDKKQIFSKYEIISRDNLPEIKPDLYIADQTTKSDQLVYIYEDVQLFVIKKQLKQIYEFYETEGSAGISLCILCSSDRQERSVSEYLDGLQDAYDTDCTFEVSTLNQYIGA